MSYRDRILDNGTDRDHWLTSRLSVIGASDAAKLSKASSVDAYLAGKLALRQFQGNVFTASGNRWEPMMLAWAGIAANKALVHSPDEPGFAATPDGVAEDLDGTLTLAETKAKHGRSIKGPTLAEWRQIAWQLVCFPEAEELQWVWVELDDTGEMTSLEPRHITVRRDDPKVVDLTDRILPIATDLLARLRAALQFEKELLSA